MTTGILTDILILVITICAAIMSGNVYPVLLLAGLLLFIATARAVCAAGEKHAPGEGEAESASEAEDGKGAGKAAVGRERILRCIQFALSAVFACVSGGWWGFLIFTTIDMVAPAADILTAGVGFVLYSLARMLMTGSFTGANIAAMIVKLILLLALGTVILLLRELICYLKLRADENRAKVINAGISELHEKKRSRELVRQNYYAEKNARLVERENISRNIHNNVGHSITAAIMTLDAADMLYDKDPEKARQKMNDAGQRIRGSLESIRSAVRALDREDEDTGIKDMICYLENIIDNFTMDTSLKVEKVYDIFSEDMMIPGEHAEFLTGVLQELLTNGVKHGSATEFIVTVIGDSGHIRLTVLDNGRSNFGEGNEKQLIEQGFGLKKIISYADRSGGHAEFTNDNGIGFKADIELPI